MHSHSLLCWLHHFIFLPRGLAQTPPQMVQALGLTARQPNRTCSLAVAGTMVPTLGPHAFQMVTLLKMQRESTNKPPETDSRF